MDFEIIEKEIKITPPVIKCLVCETTKSDKWTYAMLRDNYYCERCYDMVDKVDGIFDKKFRQMEKELKDCYQSLKDKNERLRYLEELIVELADIIETKIRNDKF